jgi:hypothetical protein
LVLACLVGCSAPDAIDAGDTDAGIDIDTETGDPDPEPLFLCEAVADPQTYADGPVVTPEPWLATPECPAYVSGPLVLELPAPVIVSGELQVEGLPATAWVKLTSHEGLGEVNAYAQDGAFAAELWPGHYDVSAMTSGPDLNQWVPLQTDLELIEDTLLMLDMPAPRLVSGAMTMDGAPPPDEFGYVQVIAETTGDSRVLPMIQLDYALSLSPGEYRFVYSWCDRSEPVPADAWSICAGFEGPAIPPDAPRIGPEQDWAPFLDVVIADDTLLDLDVPTAMVDGNVTLDGVGPENGALVLRTLDGEFSGRLPTSEQGDFAGRVVQGQYQSYIAPLGGSVPEAAEIIDDVHIEIHRESVPLSADEIEVGGFGPSYEWSAEFVRLDSGQRESFAWYELDGDEPVTMWPGSYRATFNADACWPALGDRGWGYEGTRPIAVPIASELVLDGPMHLEFSFELAALAIDLRELGSHVVSEYDHSNNRLLNLQLFAEGERTEEAVLTGRDMLVVNQELQAQGFIVPGRYDVVYGRALLGSVDIVDRTTLFLRPHSRTFTAEWTLGGVPIGSAGETNHLFMRNLDTGHLRIHQNIDNEPPNTLAPGRYELIYVGFDEYGDGFPDNTDPRVGCITIEG